MEAKLWGLRNSRNATSLNSRFKSLDTLKVKIISVTFRRVIRTNYKKASKIWRRENIQLVEYHTSQLLHRQVRAKTFCFFFSSKRRHTSFDCDWSSDVCSSD